jgi:YHS domain-containing protein
MVKDPVCGMMIDPKTAASKVEYQGLTYYFCSIHCKRKFELEPDKYIVRGSAQADEHSHH